jgi:hypothetical protein
MENENGDLEQAKLLWHIKTLRTNTNRLRDIPSLVIQRMIANYVLVRNPMHHAVNHDITRNYQVIGCFSRVYFGDGHRTPFQ